MNRRQLTNEPNLSLFQKTWKILLFLLLLSSPMTAQNCTAALKKANNRTATPNVTRIDPTNWFVDMQDPTLQLMVYGKDIKFADVTTDYPNVKIDSLVRLDSPNYLLVYLNLKGAKPGEVTLTFSNKNGKKTTKKFELKAREMAGADRKGFDISDVLYMLMPDRFANGNPKNDVIKGMEDQLCDRNEPSLRHGGDLEGLRQHLDYFTNLGVTALWLTPVLENDRPADGGKHSTYHGYATTDYYRVDPRFGTNEEYKALVDECHKKGLKVVMDMIFNHCGDYHPWAKDTRLDENGKTIKDYPSKDWFNSPNYGLQTSYKLTPVLDPYASKVDMAETVDGWFVPSMPDLNQRNPHVIKYLIQNSIWWIETVGIDGIRMDTYPYADRQAMADWMKVLNKEYPNFNTVGETWVTEPAYTAAWQKDSKLSDINSNLKTVMDFAFFDRLSQAKNEETDDWWKGWNRIYNSLCYDYLYTDPSSVMAFIENHDTDRYLGNGKDSTALKQAYALLLTMKRIPQLYYGTEILMNGTKTETDGNVRQDFPGGFPGDKVNKFTREGRTKAENAMFDWTSRLLHWRQNNDVIINGSQTQFIPQHGVYVLARQHNGKTVLTILNGKKADNQVDVARYAEVIGSHTTATDVLTGAAVDLTKNIPLVQRQAMVLSF
ncbi:glycoside hydrolase family 13 protein [Prevotella melaninogenica]|uniref:glycoside hydrolase family 13 protein n=1 Tax=Prevotella melaninogenica TaxID=28132 RepID=UPI001C5F6ED9|nr:glycoside hydrolase family 13 protein [Prevotella melaninogenica]MBW4741001.1 glycoside hydrolase family 13 protein [Prevotella melaninogenica]MBW4912825.1 glycoside hydrolase family 13 protein [Prevotella melaninogenica]